MRELAKYAVVAAGMIALTAGEVRGQTADIPLVLTDAPVPKAAKAEQDRSSRVLDLCYHRFARKKADSLSTTDKELREQMLKVCAAGFEFITMDDFLRWRRGEVNIPPLSALVTIDDGYRSTLDIAHPIFKELKVPYTLFAYTNYVGGGSQALTWDQVRQLEKEGVTIASHSVSHNHMAGLKTPKLTQIAANPDADRYLYDKAWGSDLKSPRELLSRLSQATAGELAGSVPLAGGARWSKVGLARDPYEEWVWNELYGAREIFAKELGLWPVTFAYPYGSFSDRVAQMGLEAGYEALFTVNGEEVNFSTPMDRVHRFVVMSDHPELFDKALQFRIVAATPEGDPAELPAGVTVSPGRHVLAPSRQVEITASLKHWLAAGVNPAELALKLSGFGPSPFTLDTATGQLTARPPASLRGSSHTAIITGANAKGEKLTLRWSFFLPPPGQAALPVAASATIPAP